MQTIDETMEDMQTLLDSMKEDTKHRKLHKTRCTICGDYTDNTNLLLTVRGGRHNSAEQTCSSCLIKKGLRLAYSGVILKMDSLYQNLKDQL